MSIEITSTPYNDFLLIKAKGIINDCVEMDKLFVSYHSKIRDSFTNNIVIDEFELDMPLGMVNQIEFIEYINAELPSDMRKLRIAVLMTKQYEDIGSFWEKTMTSRAYHDFKIFHELSKARAWITAP